MFQKLLLTVVTVHLEINSKFINFIIIEMVCVCRLLLYFQFLLHTSIILQIKYCTILLLLHLNIFISSINKFVYIYLLNYP